MERSEAILEPDLPIVDPHHHLWDRPATLVAALPQTGHGFEDIIRAVPRYLLDELLADLQSGHNVRATVYLECGAMYRADGPEALRCVGETEFVTGVAAMTASGLYRDVPRRLRAAAAPRSLVRHLAARAAAPRPHRSRAGLPRDDDRPRPRRHAARHRGLRGEARGAVRPVAREHPHARHLPERRGEAGWVGDAVCGLRLVQRVAPSVLRRSGAGVEALRRCLHRSLRASALHVREQLPGGQLDVQLRDALERFQIAGGEPFARREDRALQRLSGAGLSVERRVSGGIAAAAAVVSKDGERSP